jgi:chemotaxis protein MotB
MKGPGGAQRASKEANSPMVAELVPSMKVLTKELQEEIKVGKVHVSMEARGLVVSLKQAAFFPSGEDTIDPATYPILSKVAQVLQNVGNPVRLEGHTDAVPIHTARFRSNWELSAARSIAMLDVLSEQYHVPHNKLAIAGYADTAPVQPNDTEAGRASNRRVDIVILANRSLVAEPNGGGKAGAKHQAAPKSHH